MLALCQDASLRDITPSMHLCTPSPRVYAIAVDRVADAATALTAVGAEAAIRCSRRRAWSETNGMDTTRINYALRPRLAITAGGALRRTRRRAGAIAEACALRGLPARTASVI